MNLSTNEETAQEPPSTPPPHLLLSATTPDHHFSQTPFYYDPLQQSPFISITGYQSSPQTPPTYFYDPSTTGGSPVAYAASYYYPQFGYPTSPYPELTTPPMSPDVNYDSIKGSRQGSSKSHNYPTYPAPYFTMNSSYPHSPNSKAMETASSMDGSATPPCNKNVYVRGIASTETDESFLGICQQFGNVLSSKAILDLRTNECKGFGFAMYSTEKEAQIALDGLNELGYHVSFARMSATPVSGQESFNTKLKNLQDQESTNIYLSNLPLSMTENELVDLLAPHLVTSHKILTDEFGSSRGVGFARLESREIAQKIISQLGGRKLQGSQYPLQVRFADSFAQKKLKNQVAKNKRNFAHPVTVMDPTSPIFFGDMPQQYATSPIFYPPIQFMQQYERDGSEDGQLGGLEKGVESLKL